MKTTRERITFILEPREMFFSLQIGFSYVRAAVTCIHSLREPLVLSHHLGQLLQGIGSLLQYPACLCPLTLVSLWMPLPLFVTSLVFLALISIVYILQVLWRLSVRTSSSSSSSARASLSSANHRLDNSAPFCLHFHYVFPEHQT